MNQNKKYRVRIKGKELNNKRFSVLARSENNEILEWSNKKQAQEWADMEINCNMGICFDFQKIEATVEPMRERK